MNYLGDFAEDSTHDFKWSTNDGDGASITRATDGTVSVYKDNNTTQTTTGVTNTEDFDSLTGVHHCRLVLTDAFYVTGTDYQVVLSAATIDGSVVNTVIAEFSIENRHTAAGSTPPTVDEITADMDANSTQLAAIVLDTGTTLDTLIKDIPTTAEIALRTLLAADYTVVSDLGTVQSADHTAGISAIYGEVENINGEAMRGTNGANTVEPDPVGTAATPAEVATALTDIHLDHLIAVAHGDVIVNDSIIANLVSKSGTPDWTSFDNTTDALEAIVDKIVALNDVSAAEVKTTMEADNSDLDYLVTDLINAKDINLTTGVSTQYNDAGGSLGTVAGAYGDDGTDVSRPRQAITKV